MTLIKPVEDLLKQITDEATRKTMQESFEKYDFLQHAVEGNLRQQDYDRKMNETKSEIERYKETAKKWEDWSARNVPKHDELIKSYTELEAKAKALQEEKDLAVAAAVRDAAGEGKAVNVDDLIKKVDEVIAKRGYVLPSEVQKIADQEAAKLMQQERDSFFKQTVPAVMAEINNMNNLQFKHMKEFNGELFDTEKFATFRAEKKIMDMNDAYDAFVATQRREIETKKLRDEITSQVEKEFASKHNLPGSGAPAAPELGPVQMHRLGKAPALPDGTELGDNRAAFAAAAELRSEGKW
jgi:hypothetical protein